MSPKDESGARKEDGEPKTVVLFAKAPKTPPEVPFEPKVDVWPNPGWPKDDGLKTDSD